MLRVLNRYSQYPNISKIILVILFLPLNGARPPLMYPNSKIKIECDFKETHLIFVSQAFCPVE